ncbi:MAG: beta-propeller fold lactonase family protein [Silvibacterium sp.]|nr:beta-propeller fold lactonase family protein [Silvibacterium sp.]
MKYSKSGQRLLAAAVSAGIALGITSCGQSNTVDYLYVTASKNNPGQIAVYHVDQQSGALTQIPSSPYNSGGRNPVALVTSPNEKYLYVANHDDNTIVEFAIGSDAKIYPQHTYNTPGTEPTSMAINSTGTLLFVADTFQPGFSVANPGPGALVVFPINSDGSLGSPIANGKLSYWPVENNPSSVNVTVPLTSATNDYVYVVNTNSSAQAGTVSGFSYPVGSGTPTLTPVSGSACSAETPSSGNNCFQAGVAPNASASDPTGRFYYVTDGATNQLIAYTITQNGVLIPLQNGPFKTDVFPDAVTIDPSGTYLFVANYNSNDVSAYQIQQGTGAPSSLATNTFATKTGPTCVMIEPALGRYLYTSNFLDNSITGYQMNPNTGNLTGTENNPYPTAGQPTCTAAITHGNHATQHVQPTSGNGAP